MIKSLYVHIPFCIRKCLYCDFNSYEDLTYEDEYIKALTEEIKAIKQEKFNTIFVGGGTPTILSIYNLEKLLKVLKPFDAMEFTFEANPGTITIDKVKLLKEYGVNRISIGLQAWQNELLKKLGRIHKLDDFLRSYEILINLDFKNINIDLMFGIPDQSLSDWKETIENVLNLKPKHISCYSLIIEEGTPFYEMFNNNKIELVEEDIEREMYYYAVKKLSSMGIERYEISNFAQKGYECRHNITYWEDEEYIGVGAGAHSYVKNYRFSNYKNIKEYIEGIKSGNALCEKEFIDIDDEMSEFMFMGLRMIKGIEKKRFFKRFKKDIYDIYKSEIDNLIKKGLIIDDGEFIKLTDKGIDISNQVFADFLR